MCVFVFVRERESECVCVCLFMCVSGRERECVCVCVEHSASTTHSEGVRRGSSSPYMQREREFFVVDLLLQIHFVIVMIR